MDLQGVGALAAAGVAAASAPVVLIVGRWQLRATLRAAEAAQRAGIEQAQATYRAALDAVGAQAAASLDQWRRGTQREAYSAFLLAAHQIDDASGRLVAESSTEPSTLTAHQAEIGRARTALSAAYVVVDLEGSNELAVTARSIVNCSFMIATAREREAVMERARRRLAELSQRRWLGGVEAVSRDRARSLEDALDRVRRAAFPHQGDPRRGRLTGELLAAAEAAHAAMSRLEQQIDSEDREALLDLYFTGRPRTQADYAECQSALEQARREFVLMARGQLGSAEPA
ncbi:hypothetical protein [Streptomyces sp. NPDC055107]